MQYVQYINIFQLKDLAHFLVIAMVCIIGVGSFYHSLLYPDHGHMFGDNSTHPINIHHWQILNIIKYPYWQLYGETFLDYLDGKIL